MVSEKQGLKKGFVKTSAFWHWKYRRSGDHRSWKKRKEGRERTLAVATENV